MELENYHKDGTADLFEIIKKQWKRRDSKLVRDFEKTMGSYEFRFVGFILRANEK